MINSKFFGQTKITDRKSCLIKEVSLMNEMKNNSIGCTVSTCKYHCTKENYCTKNAIKVGSCNCDAKNADSTCCQSFEAKTY